MWCKSCCAAPAKAARSCFIPGNHDEFARGFVGHEFGGIEVRDDAVHTTADGRRLWVTHGDYFDGVIQCAKWLAFLGDNLYEFTLKLNRYLNTLAGTHGAAVLVAVGIPQAQSQKGAQLRDRF
jgi:UDP-2,3-diacylglucosamine pyrophosphatase LpxH